MSDLQPVRMDDFLEADIVVVELQADGETQSFLGCQPLTSKSVSQGPLGKGADQMAVAAKSLQSCLTLCDPIDRSLPGCPWNSPGKNTGVGCHFLLQCMKGKSESEVTQLCPTLHDLMDCSLPGSSIHWIFQARVLEWVAISFSQSDGGTGKFVLRSRVIIMKAGGRLEAGSLATQGRVTFAVLVRR